MINRKSKNLVFFFAKINLNGFYKILQLYFAHLMVNNNSLIQSEILSNQTLANRFKLKLVENCNELKDEN